MTIWAKDARYPYVLIAKGAVIEDGVEFGRSVSIGYNCSVKEGVRFGNHVYVSHMVVVAQGTIIEDDVFLGPGVVITNTRHICHGRDRDFTGERVPVTIKRGARIGARAVLLPGIVIGEEAMIAAGAVVTKDCEAFGVYMGCPAVKTGDVPFGERYHR
jgi:acetyltransferase-like isoleucine patch superfamily enzyme